MGITLKLNEEGKHLMIQLLSIDNQTRFIVER